MTLDTSALLRRLVLGAAFFGIAAPQVLAQPLTIGSFSVVAERKVGPGVTDVELRAVITNGGSTPLAQVFATVADVHGPVRVLDRTLRFDAVPARGSKSSTDTFVVRKAKGQALTPVQVAWNTSLGAPLSIGGYWLVGVRKVNRYEADYQYRALLLNGGGAPVRGVSAVLVDAGRAGIRDGSLSFGAVAPGQRGRSLDTFTLRRSRFAPHHHLEGLAWNLSLALPSNNRPPVAVIAPVAAPTVAQVVTLNGAGSSDPEGAALTYDWTVLSQPAGSGAVVQNAAAAVATFTPDRAGSYTVQLTVGDGTSTDARTVSFSTVNTAPVAVAGTPQTTTVGSQVTLDGSGSMDVDGDPLTFAWTIQSKPAASAALLVNPSAVMPTVTIDAPGTYVFRLVVRDSHNAASAPATVSVSTSNSAPVANAGPDQAVNGGAAVQLTGSASTDADGDPLTYQWAFVQRPQGSTATLATPGAVSASFVADRSGTFIVRLTVTDPSGAGSSDTVAVTTANTAPVAHAGPDQAVFVGSSVQLDGSGSTDVDGDALTYTWSFTSQPSGSTAALTGGNGPTPSFVVDRPGSYVAQLVVTDAQGGVSGDTVVVTTQNARPIADAGPDQAGGIGHTVTLNGLGSSDPDFDPLTYAWALLSAPAGSTAALVGDTSAQPTFVTDLIGTYVVQLVVSDGVLTSAADTVTITTANTPPVADAGADPDRYSFQQQVDLDGGLSSDADGHALTYSWVFLSRPAGSTAALQNADTRTPYFQPDEGGTYVVQLIVNDGFTDSQPDTVVIRVNTPPAVDAGADLGGTVGVPVQLAGSGTDADGDMVGYFWILTGPAGSAALLSNPFVANPTFTPDVPGVYQLLLSVTDGFDASPYDEVLVTVVGQ